MIKDKLKYLDPYHYMDLFINFLHSKNINYKIVDILIYLVYSLLLAIILLEIISIALGTKEGLMIVVSGSMEPTLNIGDIVVLKRADNIQTQTVTINKDINGILLNDFANINYYLDSITLDKKTIDIVQTKGLTIDQKEYDIDKNGTIIVYRSNILNKDIIHRSVLKIVANDGNYYLTKGDNVLTNNIIDEDCKNTYANLQCINLYPIREEDVLASYWFKIPYLGLIKIIPFRILGLM